MNKIKISKTGFIFGAVLAAVLTGCGGYDDRHSHARVYGSPPPDYVETSVAIRDDYVYYPSYQVYYSSTRRQYIYLQGRSWVTRPAPPRVSVDVLFASPSVSLDFHDAPSLHHSRVVEQYPRQWTPPGHQKDGRDDDKGNNGRGHK